MRLCYNCQHFYFDTGSPSYSEYTPGESMSMECQKDHWRLTYYDNSDLGQCLETAQTCKDYQHSDRAKQLGIPDEDAVAQTKHTRYVTDVPALCKACGTQVMEYYDKWAMTIFSNCPKCRPVNQVTDASGAIIQGKPAFTTREETYYA